MRRHQTNSGSVSPHIGNLRLADDAGRLSTAPAESALSRECRPPVEVATPRGTRGPHLRRGAPLDDMGSPGSSRPSGFAELLFRAETNHIVELDSVRVSDAGFLQIPQALDQRCEAPVSPRCDQHQIR